MKMKKGFLLLVTTAFGLIGCGDGAPLDPGDDGGLEPGGAVATVQVEKGQDQRGPPDHALPDSIVGRVLDNSGNPVAGQVVNFEVMTEDGGSFEVATLQSNGQGRVFNRLVAGEQAWTSMGPDDSTHTARLVASLDGRPDEVSTFEYVIEPGTPRRLSIDKVLEDGTRDQFGDDGRAAIEFAIVWEDRFFNPNRYEAAVEGPGHIETLDGAPSWTRSLVADSAGTGTVRLWTLPDSSEVVSGTFEVTNFNGGAETWICVVLEEGRGNQTDCEGPPTG